MRVLFVSNEVAPYAKVGGLGDVAGSLPPALAGRGIEVAVVTPLHRQCRRQGECAPTGKSFEVEMAGRKHSAAILTGSLHDGEVPVYFIDYGPYFDRPEIYGEAGADYPDAAARCAFFCRAVLALPEAIGFRPDVIHTNDWPTGLVPALSGQAATVFTIHNLGYQGRFPLVHGTAIGADTDPNLRQALTHRGWLNYMAAGIRTATVVSTVSERYAREIQTKAFGAGLERLLQARSADLFGIRNGIDYGLWDPSGDPALPARYSADELSGKAECKAALQRELGLPVRPEVPVVGSVTRMAWQKGLDLLAEAIPRTADWPLQFAVLGAGEAPLEQQFRALQAARPDAVAVVIGYDDALARRIYAGADMFVMPSRYEPCGLGQMIAMAYGTVPVVSWTGGLADTVTEDLPDRDGFVFGDMDVVGLVNALGRANDFFQDREAWRLLMRAGMARDFSWADSAGHYEKLYRTAVERAAATP